VPCRGRSVQDVGGIANDDETADKLVEVLEYTSKSLAARLELVDSALVRLMW
jgi:hypothetical protein